MNISVVSFGPWADVGMLSGDGKQSIRRQIEHGGWNFLPPQQAVMFVDPNHVNDHTIVFDADWTKVGEQQKHLTRFISALAGDPRQETLEKKKDNVKFTNVKQIIEDFVKEVSGLKNINTNAGLMSLGVDSQQIEQLRTCMAENFEIELSAAEMYEYVNVDQLQNWCRISSNKVLLKG
uniref:Carrier domain-containing protein n=1 Tax=Ditylenchus dipsaci TaxID=166011 RepID=A0A915DT55_9BILA